MEVSARISIHALREESDIELYINRNDVTAISIHALREESDFLLFLLQKAHLYFNPRSPRGERLEQAYNLHYP